MAKQIFIVSAWIVDANGAYHTISNDYPKAFSSASYNEDVAKTRKRAESDMYSQWSQMLLRDDRKVQAVMLTTQDGFVLKQETDVAVEAEEPEEPEEQ